jgi:Recombination endonuclease VII
MPAAKEPPESPTAVKARCGKWMPRAKATCGRKADHPGKCVTAKALKTDVDRPPPWTSRRWGVRGKDHPAVRARWNRVHKFNRLGITEDEFNAMLAAQGHACAMCRRPFEEGQRICADHDHNCCPAQPKEKAKTCGKCIRGLLCFRCNTALGYVELYRGRADAYLAR